MDLLSHIFIFGLVAAVANANDSYCDPEMCPAGLQHVACGRHISWGARCSDDAEFVEFTSELQEILLNAHNKLRNQQALGQTPGYSPAKRMATMQWDNELAYLARYNTMKCAIEHDQCQSTQVFYLAGQNLAKSGDAENDWIVGTRPAKWFSEYENGDMEEIRSHSSLKGANGEFVGHFTQVVKDDAYKVGCSIAKYTENGSRKSLLACNYAVSNIKNWPIYEEGETASACESGTNPIYPGLCSVDEVYNKPYFH